MAARKDIATTPKGTLAAEAEVDRFLPDGFSRALDRMGAPAVDVELLTSRLAKEGGTLDPAIGPFLPSAENLRRYGFALPKPLVALLDLADRVLIEDASSKMPSFRYLRVTPGGWELPAEIAGEPYVVTVAKRFDWNTFSNMQLWEHFAGTMSLGWDPGDNRYMVSTVDDDAPVFWMDHETAEMSNAIASSLESFLRVQVGEDEDVSERERALVRNPGACGSKYLDTPGPLTAWPPFLSARADWMIGCLAFGAPERLDRPEVHAFDLGLELPLVGTSEPVALYWLLRTYYLEERDVFDEVAPRAAGASPFTRSLAELLEERWRASPKNSSMAKVRAKLVGDERLPRKAAFTGKLSRDRLV